MGRPGLTKHRKFLRLSAALGSSIVARGALELMWESAYEAGEDYIGTAQDLETLVGWTGEPGRLASAMAEAGRPDGRAGFIEPITTSPEEIQRYIIHDLWHHAPDYVRKRRNRELERRQRQAPSAKRRRSAPNGGQRTPSLDKQTGVDRTPAPAPAPAPSPAPARGKAFAGERLVVSHSQHELFLAELGTYQGYIDLLALYPVWDRRLVESGEPFDTLKFIKARITERLQAVRSGGALFSGSAADWYDECQRLHNGECGLDSSRHRTRVTLEHARGKAAS